MRNLITIILFVLCTSSQAQEVILNLNEGWEFKGTDTLSWMPATVPGTVHTDLMSNGVIGDPFKDNNEVKQLWIENENWEYRTTFMVSENQFNQSHHELKFNGLDTYAEVYLNGQLILEANNMFRSWQAYVDTLLKLGSNELRIVFTSPIAENLEPAKNYLPLPGGSDTTKYPVAPFTRKAAYHFGWDWAPRFVTCGIWKDINLVSTNDTRLRSVQYYYRTDDDIVELEVEVDCWNTLEAKVDLHIGGNVITEILSPKSGGVDFYTEITNPKLWWPNGSGDQNLYDAAVIVYTSTDTLAIDSQKIGFRTIELINEPDSIGTSFFFKVNGKPLFVKGANYVPQDVFLPRVKPEQYQHLLALARDAGINMLRVWGGGIYEKETFYNLCDEYGILIWQDFMFANTLYPFEESDNRENILYEAEEQILRLRKHTCLALWCGNNEIEVAWKNWGWQSQYGYNAKDSLELILDYQKLFEGSLKNLVSTLDEKTPYVSTTPQSNWGTPENFNHGSMHYWGVWHGSDDFSGFNQNVGRFMAEWGFQSFPDYELLKEYVSQNELSLKSEVMKNRQKSYVGNGKISEFLSLYALYGGDASSLSFADFIYNSQWVQALGYRQAIQAHMAKQPHCMGTLLWQLNDCWPGPSWSIINYNGKPKQAYQEVKSLFNN